MLFRSHAVKTGTPVQVEVAQTIGNVTLRDTVMISVTATPASAPLASLTLHVLPGDSGIVNQKLSSVPGATTLYGALTGDPTAKNLTPPNRTLSATLLNQNGLPILNVLVRYWSSNAGIADVSSHVSGTAPMVTGFTRGQVMLHADATVYGVTRSDSILVTVIPPTYDRVNIRSKIVEGRPTPLLSFDAGTVTIVPGGTVEWVNPAGQAPIDVVFDDSTNVTGGNIPPFAYDSAAVSVPPFTSCKQVCNASGNRRRKFPVVGTYHYHSELFSTGGIVIVAPA